MKLGVEERRVDLNGLKVKSYGIGDVAVFQQVARSSMYSDPHKAAIQEYFSNCVDAMRRRHKLDPSFIPSNSNIIAEFAGAELRIKDNGIGISPTVMENGFASYYGSTKRDDDDEIGGFGLGCKTAFADPNRDSFTVDTVYADDSGRKFRYVTYHFIDKSGLTSYAELSNVPVDELGEDLDLGTTITLPIDEDDIETYVGVIRQLCKYWEVKPTVLGLQDFAWPEVVKMFKGERWAIVQQESMEVVVDGIPYIVNRHQLPSEFQAMAVSGAVLFFNTGELSITSTRESLDYRGDTVASIVERLREIQDHMQETALAQVSVLNLWDAQKVIRSIRPFLRLNEIPESFKATTISIGRRFNMRYVSMNHLNEVKSEDRNYFDYGSKFTVLLSRTKTVNLGRLASFYESLTGDDRGTPVYVLQVPSHGGGRTFHGPTGMQDFIEWFSDAHPDLRFKDILNPKYDLQSWPVHASYRSAVRKKFTKSALLLSNGKWGKIEVGNLEDLKKSRMYYVVMDTLVGKAKTAPNINSYGVAKRYSVVAITADQLDSVPETWTPFWSVIRERIEGKLRVHAQRVEYVKGLTLPQMAQEFCSYSSGLKRIAHILPQRLREVVRNVTRGPSSKPRLNLDEFYPIIKTVNLGTPLATTVVKTFRRKGGVWDRDCFHKLSLHMRKVLREDAAERLCETKNNIKAIDRRIAEQQKLTKRKV